MFAYLGPGQQSPTIVTRLYGHNGPLGCDVETVSLEDRTPLGAAFAISPKEAFYFTMDDPMFPWLKLRNPNQEIIFHNSGFDVPILEDYSGEPVTNVLDSCIAALLLGLPGRLSDLSWALFNKVPRPIEDLIGKGKDQITMDKVPFSKVAERGCLDAMDALDAWLALKNKVPAKALDLETRILPVALDIERRGIWIDQARVHEHRERLERVMVFYKMIAEGMGFNPGSSQQLAIMLESKGYHVPYRKGKDGKRRPRLNKEVLETYFGVEPLARLTLTYRSSQTLLTHLIRPLDEGKYIKNGKIHPRVNLGVAASGRITRSKPATQNIQNELRDIIIPSPGNEIYCWDFSQIELRVAAYIWEDRTMQRIFAEGLDVHVATADELVAAGLGSIMGDTPRKRRRLAKDINFLMLFGGDEETMWNRKRIPRDIGAALKAGYFSRFKGIANGIQKTKDFALQNGYTETMYGRRRMEEEKLNSGKNYLVEDALRELINHPIQGSAAEILKEAMWADKKEPQFHTVHDEMLLDVEPGYQYLGRLNKLAPFDTPIEAKVGPNWKDMISV